MKKTLLIISLLLVCLSVSAQKKMTDREFEGYKGAVKSVLNEHLEIVNSLGLKPDKTRKKSSQYFFDSDGRLSEILYDSSNVKGVFSVIDGFKTFKGFKPEKETKELLKSGLLPEDYNKTIEEPEKLTPPDNRFEQKFVYEYDSQGRIVTERVFLNNNKLILLSTFIYDHKGRLAEKKWNTIYLIGKDKHKYNDNGNELEKIMEAQSKDDGQIVSSRIVYSKYKIDEKGNWTQRKNTFYFELDGKSKTSKLMEYRTIVYY